MYFLVPIIHLLWINEVCTSIDYFACSAVISVDTKLVFITSESRILFAKLIVIELVENS